MRRCVPECLSAACLCALACEKPAIGPGLDQYACGGDLCPAPGVIQGSLVYSGTARGDAIVLLFDASALPPRDGNGTGAAAIARVAESALFRNAPGTSIGPFSAPFTFTQVPSGRGYWIRAFIDASGEFDPFFDYAQQPRTGDPVGAYGEPGPGQPRLLPVQVAPGQMVRGVNVELTQTMPYDPPSFELVGGSQTLDPDMDRPVRLKLRTTRLAARSATFENARFALELDRDLQGNRRSGFGDGLDDVFPRVFLRQLSGMDGQGNPVPTAPDGAAIVPCRVNSLPVLPALVSFPPGATPVARDTLEVLVQPWALAASDLAPLPSIPRGTYQVVVIERSGQAWTLPNQLGDPAAAGTPDFAPSQSQVVTVAPQSTLPANSVSGVVEWRGDPSIKSGNIVVQAYLDDRHNPPPPLGAARPVRVRIIPESAVIADVQGFTVPYRIDGLPQGSYVVQALADVDGNFSLLNPLETPTSGDLVGGLGDPGSSPAVFAGVGNATGKDIALRARVSADPPSFEIDPATPAQMPADQATPVRFDLRSKPLVFPPGRTAAPHFAVQLVRDPGGVAVDADHDGLADVWPRVFLVRLDPSDPTGLTQYGSPDLYSTRRQVIPAAVDPTPFMPALQPQPGGNAPPVLTDRLTIVVRPALFDASTPGAPPERLRSLQPGPYKIVLVSQAGQVWEIPNASGSAALDPAVVCPASASACAPGTVQTQSQSEAFQVGPPAHAASSGGIAGTLSVAGNPLAAYVFAYAANALPPFGRPFSAAFHTGADFQGGSVSYVLPDLPAGEYVVTAVVDMRGDFAAWPPLFALAPGAGNLMTDASAVHVDTTFASVNLSPARVLPQRPSFELLDPSGNPATADVNLELSGRPNASFLIKPVAILGSGVALLHPDSSGGFALACDSIGKPVGDSLEIELVKVGDAAGLVPQIDGSGKATVIFATLDHRQFSAGTCTPGSIHLVANPVTALTNGSAKLSLTDPSVPRVAVPLEAGRYAVVITSMAKQVWRIPNELQPALLDAGALLATPHPTRSLLQTQQAAVTLMP
jgi:uncharacterized protein (DUF2141 family)